MLAENYAGAATLFEEVVKLSGYGPKYSNHRDRLTFYKRQVTAYQNLIKCYAHLNNAEKTFQAIEASRSRVLLERLGENSYQSVSLANLQNLLQPDEACIMYSVTAGHEIIILTVTKKYSQVLFHEDPRFIADLRDKYKIIPQEGDRKTVPRWYWEGGHFKKQLGDLLLERLMVERPRQNAFGFALDGKTLTSNQVRIAAERAECVARQPALFLTPAPIQR